MGSSIRGFHFFTLDEIRLLIDKADNSLRPVIVILSHTGMRRAEIWYLRWRDVDLAKRIIHIRPYDGFTTKSRQGRSVPMTDELYALLADRPHADNCVCRPYVSIHTMRREFEKLLKNLRMTGTLHDLRHTFASHLVMAGVPVPAAKELLGHSDISTTIIYAHLAPETHRAAIEKLPY